MLRTAAFATLILSSALLGACGSNEPTSPNPTSPQVRVAPTAQPAPPPPAQATRPPMVRG